MTGGDHHRQQQRGQLAERQDQALALRLQTPLFLGADALAGIFRKLPPRLYSIASSPLAHPDEVHLTVSAVRYQSHGRERKGVCSTYLADLVKSGDPVQIFVQPNKNFRLPDDGTKPVIAVAGCVAQAEGGEIHFRKVELTPIKESAE